MDIFKATDGKRWYISIDRGQTFEWCQREPFLGDGLAAPLDSIPLTNTPDVPKDELSLNREQLQQRGYTIAEVTTR